MLTVLLSWQYYARNYDCESTNVHISCKGCKVGACLIDLILMLMSDNGEFVFGCLTYRTNLVM